MAQRAWSEMSSLKFCECPSARFHYILCMKNPTSL
jgi:hypothetical protein